VSEEQYRTALADLAKPPKGIDSLDDPVSFVMRVLAQTRTYHNVALAQVAAGVPFVPFTTGIDMMGHGFQHFLPPRCRSSRKRTICDAAMVPNFYAWRDELLGEMLRVPAITP
jgi:hypothetical protein